MMSPTISLVSSPPPLSPTTLQLDPPAKSWLPENSPSKTPLEYQASSDQARQTAIMYPHEFFTIPSLQSPPSPPTGLTLSSVPSISQPFQQFHVHHSSLYICGVFHFNQAGFSCYKLGCQLQPQPTVLPLTFWTPAAHYEVENADLKKEMDENGTSEKRDSRIFSGDEDFKNTSRRFVPPRFRKTRSLESQGSVKKSIKRQMWKLKKAKSDDGVVAAGNDGVVVVPSPPPLSSAQSSLGGFPRFKNTTVMIRNIPNQYRYNCPVLKY